MMEFVLRILLVLLYVLWLPAMLLGRLAGRDPLQRKKPIGQSHWLIRAHESTRESYYSEDSLSEGRPAQREGEASAQGVGLPRTPLLAMVLRRVASICCHE